MMIHFDSLYCEENHQWEDDDADEDGELPLSSYMFFHTVDINHSENSLLQCEDQELSYLISKESQQHLHNKVPSTHHRSRRREAVEWILRVVSHYSFSALTAVLAVNYLDRFLERLDGLESEKEQPWMTHLAAVSCLSLAAKVEETHAPLLLDLQTEGRKYVFDAKTIQRMEILILSTLQWKMNPVTPLSFLDYITRRLGLKTYLSLQLFKRCECLLICFLPDDRFRSYLPSVIATATMMHVISGVEPCIGNKHQSQLLGILGIDKAQVEECWKHIQEITFSRNLDRHFNKQMLGAVPGSPDAVVDLSFSSGESWSVVSSLPEPVAKKSRKGEET